MYICMSCMQDGETALMAAARGGHTHIAAYLLLAASPHTVDATNHVGYIHT
ncbi:hypothetical protein EON65_19750 [archaeon]|nr:MAG: hypothetical protein EON65_19750 [archaeon]